MMRSSMGFSVSKKAPTLVAPSAPTPTGRLPLSADDRTVPLFFFVHGVIVFGEGKKQSVATGVVREALAKALVPYYPVAGRIVADPRDGELGIACTGEGVWFVEASADCSLESLGDVNLYFQEQPLLDLSPLCRDKLLPCLPLGLDHTTVPLMLQVTEFSCGGFMLGFKFSHAMFDGVGMGQFVVAMGEMARGLAEPKTKPVWCRNAIPRLCPGPTEEDLLSSADTNPPAIDTKVLLPYTIDLPLEHINELKDRFERENAGVRCTAFDIVAAKLWQCRTRAMDLQPHVVVSVHFLANIRHLMHDRLPPVGGYYGNCLNFVVIEGQAGHIANSPFFEIVRLIKEAKDRLPTQFSRWLKGLGAAQPSQPSSSTSLFLVDWRRLGLFEADFGCGPAKYVVSFDEPPVMLLNSPAPTEGIRLVTKCVAEEHFEAFRNNMSEWY